MLTLLSVFWKKKELYKKTPNLENQKNFSSLLWKEKLQILNVLWQHSTIGLRTSISIKFLLSKFFYNKNKQKNALSKKPEGFATTERTLTAPLH